MAVNVRPRPVQAQGQQTQAAQPANPKAQVVVPFTRAARKKSMLGFDTGTVALSAAAPVTPAPILIPAAGYLRFIEVAITLATAANAATVTFAADAPWNAIQQIGVTNSAGDPIITPLTGYQWFLINKYGALSQDPPNCDPRAVNNGFLLTAGAGATGGSATFTLRLPFEYDPRDAFCAVPNMASNKSYMINVQYSATATIYGTSPTSPPTIRLQGTSYFWSQPSAVNEAGVAQATAPISAGSIAMWRLQTTPVTAGDRIVQLTNTGNVLRCLIFILRTSAQARTQADLAAINQIVLNNDTLFYLPLAQWLGDMVEAYGYTTGAAEAVSGLDNGVLVIPYFMDQRGKVLCDSPRDQYLPTLDATLLQLRATSFGANAVTLEILSNEVKPISAQALYSPNVV